MCRAWNHPSYQAIERLLPLLGVDARPLCRACGHRDVRPPTRSATGVLPKMPRRQGSLVRRRASPARQPQERGFGRAHGAGALYPVEERDVDGAIGWLDEHWRAGCSRPTSSCRSSPSHESRCRRRGAGRSHRRRSPATALPACGPTTHRCRGSSTSGCGVEP